ncbi:MAG: ribonuclease III [Clostridia bacterium]|nr:ribonuclease III [Clostridia bacterium]
MAEGRNLQDLEKYTGYHFSDIKLLKTACTHTSYVNENKKEDGLQSYQRLEFLGDAVLQLIISEYLFARFPESDEGDLTKYRQHLVCEETLAKMAERLCLGQFVFLGKGEENNDGRHHPPILADVFEALLAAIYLDMGEDTSFLSTFLISLMKDEIEMCGKIRGGDYKTRLQQLVQQDGKEHLSYVVTKEYGPDHRKTFEVDAMLNSNPIGHGVGPSVPKAEQEAAKQALKLFGIPI